MNSQMPDSSAEPMHHTIADSRSVLSQVVFPKDTDELGHATAGYILKLIDIAGSLSARYHTQGNTVTASLDFMNFDNPIHCWDLVNATAQVTRVWSSSLEVEVTVTAKRFKTLDESMIARGFLVFVALDESMKPTKAPALTYTSENETLMAQNADLRRQNRILEKQHWGDRETTRIETEDHATSVRRLMTPDDANVYQNVFGGVILEMTHEAALKAAKAHAKTHLTTVRQERMSFENPAKIGEFLEARAVVTRSWSSSIEVQIELYAQANTTDAPYRLISSSFLVFVALDDDGKAVKIPAFEPQTHRQQVRFDQASLRRQSRLNELQISKNYKPS